MKLARIGACADSIRPSPPAFLGSVVLKQDDFL
jgi:hypothetical protein